MKVAIDIDGPLVTCRAVGAGGVCQFVALTTAHAAGPEVGRVAYRIGETQKYFGVKEPSGLDDLPEADSPLSHRVRIQDALLRVLEGIPGTTVDVTLAASFQSALGAGGEDPAESLRSVNVERWPSPAAIRIGSSRSLQRTVAAYVDWMTDDAGHQRKDRDDNATYTYVDIGPSRTWVARLGSEDEAIDPNTTQCLDRGWLAIASALEAVLRESHGTASVRPSVVANILLSGEYRLRGRLLRADGLIAGVVAGLAADIQMQIDGLGGDDPVIVVGIPAGYVAERLAEQMTRPIIVPDDPAYANVRGLLKFAASFPTGRVQ